MTPISPTDIRRPSYTGSVGALYRIIFLNIFLSILTLGIYRFWGRAKLRRYLWSHVHFEGESFTFLGTGTELFKGFIRFFSLIALPFFIASGLIDVFIKGARTNIAYNIIWYTVIFIGIFYVNYLATRYRLSRTSWRGIRFELRGSASAYVRLRVKNIVLTILTLGLYAPYAAVAMLHFFVQNVYFGSLRFRYTGNAKELRKTFFICWLLLIPTLGFSMVWYRAKYIAHVAKHTKLKNLEFRCKIEGKTLLLFNMANAAMLLLSIGIAYPYILQRRMIFYTRHIKYKGTLPYDQIAQAQKNLGTEGGELTFGLDGLAI
jgi:uncharacterized membrane protein YjgN (DUF898 family)